MAADVVKFRLKQGCLRNLGSHSCVISIFLGAMADFGPADLILTKHMNQQMLIYECNGQPQNFYLFRQKSRKRLANGQESIYYVCRGCEQGFDGNAGAAVHLARVAVREGRVITDPNLGHTNLCQPIPKAEVEVRYL